MKKLLSIILVVAMMLTMTAFMSGCGEDAKEPDDTDSGVTDLFPEALANVETIDVPELAGTIWTFAGGCVDGKDMEQETANAILEEMGGVMMFEFIDEETLQLVVGIQEPVEAAYTVEEDYVYSKVIETEYYFIFTDYNGTTAMLIATATTPDTAYYMIPADEG